jgi:hypothetical protein
MSHEGKLPSWEEFMRHSLGFVLVACLFSTVACSSSSDGAPAGDTGTPTDTQTPGDTGGTDTASPTDTSSTTDTAPTDAGDLCSKLPANTAPEITDSVDTTAVPGASATGGAIESGTYEQTGHVYYQPTSTPTHKWSGTMAIDAAAGTSIANIKRDGAVFQQTGSTFTTAGNKFTVSFTCPSAVAGTSFTLTYTYAAGKLTIFTEADKTATIFQKK